MKKSFACLGITLASALILCQSPLSARSRQLDLGKRNSSFKSSVNPSVKKPQMNTSLSGKPIQFADWHKNFSNLGQKKAPLSLDKEAFNREIINKEFFTKKKSNLKLSSDERKMATVRNWNSVREMVMVSKFSKAEITSPAGRKFSELLDEVTLEEINRFQTVQNTSSETAIPVTPAGGSTPVGGGQ